jgi:hypothetical protein
MQHLDSAGGFTIKNEVIVKALDVPGANISVSFAPEGAWMAKSGICGQGSESVVGGKDNTCRRFGIIFGDELLNFIKLVFDTGRENEVSHDRGP